MKKTLLGYIPEESPVYQLHPLTRVMFLLIVSIYPMLVAAPEWNLALTVLILGLLVYARVRMDTIKNYIPIMGSMGFIILISYTIFGGYEPSYIPIGHLGSLTIYFQPIRWAIVTYMRLIPMIFIVIFFFSTSRERDLIVALRTVRVPFAMTYLVGMGLRSVGMVMEDFQIVREAEKARGFDTRGKSLYYKLRKFIMYIVPLFGLALRRSEEFSNALTARAYTFRGLLNQQKRADYVLSHYHLSPTDYLIIFTLIIALIALVILRYHFGLMGVESTVINKLVLR